MWTKHISLEPGCVEVGDLISQDQRLHLVQARDLAVRQNQKGHKTKTESVKVNFEL